MIKTRHEELRKFDKLLMKNSPPGYKPWYFPVQANGKDPDFRTISFRGGQNCKCGSFWEEVYREDQTKFKRCFSCKVTKSSWKSSHAQMTIWESLEHLKSGLNVGIGARRDDKLILIDLDDDEVPDMKKKTLQIQSRSRKGRHRMGFAEDEQIKTNIPTEQGELRSLDEYVVAPGSYVPCSEEEIKALPTKEQKKAGLYTVEANDPATGLKFEDLPEIFKERINNRELREDDSPTTNKDFKLPENASKIFSVDFKDILPGGHSARFHHPLHASHTGQNFCIQNDKKLSTCWRDMVTLTPMQYLAVKAGYDTCENMGTPHPVGKRKYQSRHKGDPGVTFYAWKQAKIDDLIPDDDPLPVKAMIYLAIKHRLIPATYNIKKLPCDVYNKILELDLGAE